MEFTVQPGNSARVLALAISELQRMEAANDACHLLLAQGQQDKN